MADMTRSKELRRIERSIRFRDETELKWAVEFCRWRLSLALKSSRSVWHRVQKRVNDALEQSQAS